MTQQAVALVAPAWGASLGFAANFSGRWGLVSSARQLIAELCTEYLEPTESSAALVMAAQELLANLAKYATDDSASFEFSLALGAHGSEVTLRTKNAAAEAHLAQATSYLERIVTATDPVALYDEWVASSAEREGSRLGLIRLRAEAGLSLDFANEAGRLCIEARGVVEPRMRRA